MVISFEELTLDPMKQGPIWSHRGGQLDVNILYFEAGQGVELHTNPSLDVWVIVISGAGEATIDNGVYSLAPGTCLYIPAGASRSIRSVTTSLVYASCHQKRPALMPIVVEPGEALR